MDVSFGTVHVIPSIFMSSKVLGGGGMGRPLFVEKRMGTRPAPRVFMEKRPGGGGRRDEGGRVIFGGGKRPNGEGRLIFVLPMEEGGNGRGHVELVVVAVAADVLAVVTATVDECSVDEVDFGLVLLLSETLLLVDVSSLSALSDVSVSVNRLDLKGERERETVDLVDRGELMLRSYFGMGGLDCELPGLDAAAVASVLLESIAAAAATAAAAAAAAAD